ncbi:TonB-dependent receptor [Tenacibaculum ovolyticum]|uniref:TonB-dependent receptor domain-containing protein n=1 Tax=Tenacibaculum ovolyticum TaxID=104270 RepID=UPI0022F390A5|nr:TonB-dependent receptor [Tenacibaculum ovolyticum]WBX77076.1 TonB-dependent receptor [Tenacibaculum ovolyticum]
MKNILFILLFFNTILLSAQINITGKVVEENTKQPLEFATIILTNPTTGKLIIGETTNNKGEFSINAKKGNYNIKIEFIGFKNHLINNISITKNHSLQTIFLKENSQALDEIEVIAEKSTTEYKLDKRVFNVGKDLISKGGSVDDILNSVPSVNVDIEGAVSLRGNANVRILINGKPSVLTANNGLQSIPSESIEKVEVITNPSAKYDAEGTGGIINIILKRNKNGGFGSSLQLTTGIPHNHSINYNINYKKEKFNLFSNVSYRYRSFDGNGYLNRTNYVNNTITSFSNRTTNMNRSRRTFNLYFGSDYYINDKNTLTLSYYLRNNTSKNTVDYTFNFLDNLKQTDNILISKESYREPQVANQIELNYVKTFTKKGQKFTANFQYDFWNDDENESVEEQEQFPTTSAINLLKSRDIESSKDFLFQSDFKSLITQKSHIEMGLKGEIRNINSDYKVWDNTVLIDSLDNLLKYNERIYGAYVQYGNRENKLQYLLGLRAEYANTGSDDRKNKFKTAKSYTDLFPTAHFTYNFNNATNMQLSYSRRIRRPSFWHLNPFGGISDRRNIRVGNPDLNPMYTNSFELGFLKRWSKFTFNPSVYYQKTTNVFETLVTSNTDGALISKPINSGTENRFGTELAIRYSPYKWWRLSSEFNYYSFNQRGIYTIDDSTWSTRLNSRMKFSKLTLQSSFNYNGERQSGQIFTEAQYRVNLGVSKDILNDKATVTLNMNNILDSRVRKQLITGNDYTINSYNRPIGRFTSVTFTYRFNRTKKDRDRLPD